MGVDDLRDKFNITEEPLEAGEFPGVEAAAEAGVHFLDNMVEICNTVADTPLQAGLFVVVPLDLDEGLVMGGFGRIDACIATALAELHGISAEDYTKWVNSIGTRNFIGIDGP